MLSNYPHVRFFIGDVRDKDRLILLIQPQPSLIYA
jgi:hypothetical protein